MTLKLFIAEIVDRFVRENFQKIDSYLRDDPWRKGSFKFFSRSLAKVDAAATYPAEVSFTHGLGFIPKDVILLSISPDTVTVTPKYDSFSRSSVTFRISAACTIRAYIGRYEEISR